MRPRVSPHPFPQPHGRTRWKGHPERPGVSREHREGSPTQQSSQHSTGGPADAGVAGGHLKRHRALLCSTGDNALCPAFPSFWTRTWECARWRNTKSLSFPPNCCPKLKGLCHASGHPPDGVQPGPGQLVTPSTREAGPARGTGVGDIWGGLFSNPLPYTSPDR